MYKQHWEQKPKPRALSFLRSVPSTLGCGIRPLVCSSSLLLPDQCPNQKEVAGLSCSLFYAKVSASLNMFPRPPPVELETQTNCVHFSGRLFIWKSLGKGRHCIGCSVLLLCICSHPRLFAHATFSMLYPRQNGDA